MQTISLESFEVKSTSNLNKITITWYSINALKNNCIQTHHNLNIMSTNP